MISRRVGTLLTTGFVLLALFFTFLTQSNAGIGAKNGGTYPLNEPTPIPAPAPVTTPWPNAQLEPTQDPLLVINGEPLYEPQMYATLRMDRALAQILGAPPTSDRGTILEQLVNQALLLQQAQALGIQISPADVANRLNALLAARGLTRADLEDALAAADIPYSTFLAYFGQLLTVETAARQLPLRQLQGQARISYSPAAAALLQPTVESQPTPAVIPSPAPTVSAQIGTAPGNLAPGFALTWLSPAENGGETLRMDDLRGRPIVLSFWTSWCPYCQRQTPLLVEAYHRYADESVQFVGVNVKEDPTVVTPYVQTHQIPYPIVLDAEGQVANGYLVRGFPTTYFLDARGVVVARHIGQLKPEQLEAYISDLLTTFSLEDRR